MDLHYGSGREYLSDDATFLERTSAEELGTITTVTVSSTAITLKLSAPPLQELPNCPQSAQKWRVPCLSHFAKYHIWALLPCTIYEPFFKVPYLSPFSKYHISALCQSAISEPFCQVPYLSLFQSAISEPFFKVPYLSHFAKYHIWAIFQSTISEPFCHVPYLSPFQSTIVCISIALDQVEELNKTNILNARWRWRWGRRVMN